MSRIVVRPLRFTDDIPGMRRFLELVGLRPRIESTGGGWVDLVGGGGMVALHTAASSDTGGLAGQTRLSFETDDLDGLAASLKARDVPEVAVYDEAYGRALSCRDPAGDLITVDERITDMYGYRQHAGEAPSTPTVAPVRYCDPAGPYGGFLRALGLARSGPPSESYVTYAAAEGAGGVVALHHVQESEPPLVSGPAPVQLSLQSSEALEAIADRLEDAGFAPFTWADEWGPALSVTDPDGQPVTVRAAP
jgi:hypothetical protein